MIIFRKLLANEIQLMKSSTSLAYSALCAIGLLASPAVATATTYQYQVSNPVQASAAGHIDSLLSTYDGSSHELSWQTTISGPGSTTADSFWVVLSGGPNPKGISDQLPIFYLDGSKSFDANGLATGVAPTLSAYAYNGQNGFTSFSTPGVTLLSSAGGAWDASNSLVATGDNSSHTLGFTIDTSLLDNAAAVGVDYAAAGASFNGADWEGAGYGSQVGVWFHAVTTDSAPPTYDAQGTLTSFHLDTQTYVDNSYQGTTVVPEPSSAIMIALAGLVLIHRRSRRVSAL
ncbi:MAG: hypothetical protein JWO94_2127 [Verrucomicrobiaceae bacterium]|nr:hypothetical protein [Verrucomicrobiaceae bacterium]